MERTQFRTTFGSSDKQGSWLVEVGSREATITVTDRSGWEKSEVYVLQHPSPELQLHPVDYWEVRRILNRLSEEAETRVPLDATPPSS